MDAEAVFTQWMSDNQATAEKLTMRELMRQTWWSAFSAGRIYQADHPFHALTEIYDLKAPKPMIGEFI